MGGDELNGRLAWNPSVNPTNILFCTGTAFAGWRGSLFVSGLGSKQLQRFDAQSGRPGRGTTGILLGELGLRFRDIRQGPDGALYVLTEGRPSGNDDVDGAVLRIEAASEATGA